MFQINYTYLAVIFPFPDHPRPDFVADQPDLDGLGAEMGAGHGHLHLPPVHGQEQGLRGNEDDLGNGHGLGHDGRQVLHQLALGQEPKGLAEVDARVLRDVHDALRALLRVGEVFCGCHDGVRGF